MDDRKKAKQEIKQKMKEHDISPEELKESIPAPRKSSREAKEPDLQRRRGRRHRQGRGMITRGSLLGHEPVVGNGPRPVTQGSVLGNGKEISDRIWGRRR